MLNLLRRFWKTEQRFKHAVSKIQFEPLGHPIQTAFHTPNLMTLIEERISKRGTLIHSMTESSTQFLSIRTLSGVSAGKSPPKTPLGVKYNTFLDYGRALRPAREYRLPNRIGFETSDVVRWFFWKELDRR